jgi:hypothetical protein
MVRAILETRKTVTRRVVKPAKCLDAGVQLAPCEIAGEVNRKRDFRLCPYGQPGDRLWVRETWSTLSIFDKIKPSDMDSCYAGTIRYMADGFRSGKLRPSIFMPRWASRILLEVTAVHVEHLHAITPDQAIAEGVNAEICCQFLETSPTRHTLKKCELHGFAGLWESINGTGSWDANPWVWVVEFRRIQL